MSLGDEAIASLSVLDGIIARALLEPDHLAAQDDTRELNYEQLIAEVARIGSGLKGRGVCEGDRVALLIPNSVNFVVAALACLWVGAIFVPLATTDPKPRLKTVIADCTPALIITDNDGDHASLFGSRAVPIDDLRQEGRGRAEKTPSTSRPVYLIYTSGTTGTPKGVQIGGTAFAAAVWSTATALALNPSTKTLCVSPFYFDGSYANLFPTLVSGGAVIIRPRDDLLYPRTFFKTVEAEKITYSGFTPTYLRLLIASRGVTRLNGSTLETIALGGESVSAADLRELWSKVPAIRVFNRYGPTETTIAVTNVELTPETIERGVVPIGRPHPGVSFELKASDGSVTKEVNQAGELYIGGAQLMDGYWGDPELTKEVLRTDVVPHEVVYRTGDLVFRGESGDYVYVDRADRVVKRSGVRISLVEVSALMSMVDGVRSAACVTFDHEGDLGIVAFVALSAEHSNVELRRAARKLIPENMLPDRIERVPSMPLNRSNQLDENHLLLSVNLKPYRRVPTEAPI